MAARNLHLPTMHPVISTVPQAGPQRVIVVRPQCHARTASETMGIASRDPGAFARAMHYAGEKSTALDVELHRSGAAIQRRAVSTRAHRLAAEGTGP